MNPHPLRIRRMSQGLRIKDLADMSKVQSSTISTIETRKHQPRIETLTKLCEALGCDLVDLIEKAANEQTEGGNHEVQTRE